MKFAVLVFVFIAVVNCQFAKHQQISLIPLPYTYEYKVENPATNTFFGASENGDTGGNKIGNYYVVLPDGRRMTVNYVADENGYVPNIVFTRR